MNEGWIKFLALRMKSNTLQILAWVGTTLVVAAYFLVSSGLLSSENILFPVLNFLGAIFLGMNLFQKKAPAAFFLQAVWACISLFGLVKILFFT